MNTLSEDDRDRLRHADTLMQLGKLIELEVFEGRDSDFSINNFAMISAVMLLGVKQPIKWLDENIEGWRG